MQIPWTWRKHGNESHQDSHAVKAREVSDGWGSCGAVRDFRLMLGKLLNIYKDDMVDQVIMIEFPYSPNLLKKKKRYIKAILKSTICKLHKFTWKNATNRKENLFILMIILINHENQLRIKSMLLVI